jgi:hypothetical protein
VVQKPGFEFVRIQKHSSFCQVAFSQGATGATAQAPSNATLQPSASPLASRQSLGFDFAAVQ